MKVNLLQGTCTPTLTPMPGVHKGMEPTAYSVRSSVAPASGSGSCLALALMTWGVATTDEKGEVKR